MVRYKNNNIYFDKKRDTERSLNTVVSKDIGKGWSVSGISEKEKPSNIDLYDYRKTSTQWD